MSQSAEGKAALEAAAERKKKMNEQRNDRKAYNANPQNAKQNASIQGGKKAAGAKQAASAAADRGRAEAANLKASMEAAKGAGGARKSAGGGGAPDDPLKQLEAKLMPKVKEADGLLAAGDAEGALALYSEALAGFAAAGIKRPKLLEKKKAAEAELEEEEFDS